MNESKPEAALVKLNDEEGVKRILTDAVFGLWQVVNTLTRLQPSRRATRSCQSIRASVSAATWNAMVVQ